MVRTYLTAAIMIAALVSGVSAFNVTIDGNGAGRTFGGVGYASCNGCGRLLIDYPEPYRSTILDLLFKPKFGAGVQHLKIEIGGGENSTDGSEPSHAVIESEKSAPLPRGYEIWLLGEAKKRNPKLVSDALAWCYPAWANNGYYATPKSTEWYVSFLQVVRNTLGFDIDYLDANRNEAYSYDKPWIMNVLRPACNSAGFTNVKFAGPDLDHDCWLIFNDFDTDPAFASAMSAVSYHYDPNLRDRAPTAKAKDSGKPLWSSEMHCYTPNPWQNALLFARGINANYIVDKITSTQIWYGIEAMYPGLFFNGFGMIQAASPWSGYYAVNPMTWAYAHTTQFTEIGWKYLDGACGQIVAGNTNGSYVTLRDTASGNWSMIVCTESAASMTAAIAGGLSTGTVSVWKTDQTNQFVKQPDITPAGGSFTISLSANSIYSLTTTTGQQKGSVTIPAAQPFPFPYSEKFEGQVAGKMPRYMADMKGSFEVCQRPGGGNCVKQIVPAQGLAWTDPMKPNTIFGDDSWTNYDVNAEVFIDNGDVEIGGRWQDMYFLGYRFTLNKTGAWTIRFQNTALRNGSIAGFNGAIWHTMKLRMQNTMIEGFVDNTSVVSFTDASRSSGRAFLASSYNQNMFDNLLIGAPGVPADPWTRKSGLSIAPIVSVVRHSASSGATIRYSCISQGRVTLAVFDMRGNKVRVLIDGMHVAGSHEVIWDGRNDHGGPAGNGSYLLRMVRGGHATEHLFRNIAE